MAKSIKITIRGKDHRGIDAPTVDDLLQQIQDFVVILRGIEGAVSENTGSEIDWRVTDASRNSPLTIEVTPYPTDHAVNIDGRVVAVVGATSKGFEALASEAERPLYFSDHLIARAESIFKRTTNGLAETNIDLSEYGDVPDILVTDVVADQAIKNVAEIKNPTAIPYRELGSVEGYIAKVELDGFNRPILWLRQRLDRQLVKCVTKGRALDRIGHYEVAEILSSMRVQAFGLVHFKDLEKIDHVDVEQIHIFEADDQLPGIADIVDPDFTGGVEASEYLRRLRECARLIQICQT